MQITEKVLAKAFVMGFVYAQELDDTEIRASMQVLAEKLLSEHPGPAVIIALEKGPSQRDLDWIRQARELLDIQNRLRKLTQSEQSNPVPPV